MKIKTEKEIIEEILKKWADNECYVSWAIAEGIKAGKEIGRLEGRK